MGIDAIYTAAQVAARLGIHQVTVLRRAKAQGIGRLVGSVRFYDEADVKALARPVKKGRPPKTPDKTDMKKT